jgi:hypothetical protein
MKNHPVVQVGISGTLQNMKLCIGSLLTVFLISSTYHMW